MKTKKQKEREKKWRKNHRDKCRIYGKRYREKNREVIRKRALEYKKRYKRDIEKDKMRSRTAHKHSLKNKKCFICNLCECLERHHLDYKDIDNFIVLCVKHHRAVHRTYDKLLIGKI